MDDFHQLVYVTELKTQSALAILAIKELTSSIETIRDKSVPESDRFSHNLSSFRHIHSFLTHASNVSKLFWPMVSVEPPKKPDKLIKWQFTTNRGQELRTLYDIQPGNALENRELRNHMEHFDERLDEFLAERDNIIGQVVTADMIIGPVNSEIGGLKPDFFIRQYDPYDGIFTFRGIQYKVPVIDSAVVKVYKKSVELLQ